MTVKIELLSITPSAVSVALYYPVTVPIAEANDQSRTAAGLRLSAQELQNLKDGTLFELVAGVSINRLTKAQTKSYIEGLWDARKAEAEATYAALYRDINLVGKAFDGTSWS